MTLSRRSFLAASTAAVAVPAFIRAADQDPWGGFTVGVQSYTFRSFKLDRMLKATQDLGLKYAEFYNGHIKPNSTPEAIKAIKKTVLGIRCDTDCIRSGTVHQGSRQEQKTLRFR